MTAMALIAMRPLIAKLVELLCILPFISLEREVDPTESSIDEER